MRPRFICLRRSALFPSIADYRPTVNAAPISNTSVVDDKRELRAEDEEYDTIGELLPSTLPTRLRSRSAVALSGDLGAFEDTVVDFFETEAFTDLIWTASRGSLGMPRVDTRRSTATTTTLAPDVVIRVPLEHLAQQLHRYASLRDAEIVYSECYKEPMRLGIVHRFLILELRRAAGITIWVRLDRSRDQAESIWSFVTSGARTRAYDTVKVAASKGHLIGPVAVRENQQAFRIFLRLGELHHLIDLVGDELTTYQLLSWNCWFFVSLLQQHLGVVGKGYMLNGKLRTLGIDPQTRDRIARQVKVYCAANSPKGIQTPALSIALVDLETYARYTLRSVHGLERGDPGLLAYRARESSDYAQDSFVWLVIACHYVMEGDGAKFRSRERLLRVADCRGLDRIYGMVLEADGTDKGLAVRLQFVRLMLSVRESLPLNALLELLPSECFPVDAADVLSEVQHLSPVLCGVDRDSAHKRIPVAPYHISFVEFFGDMHGSGKFHISSTELLKLRTLRNAAKSVITIARVFVGGTELSPRDVELFVHLALRYPTSNVSDRAMLARKAGGSVDWAIEACRVVMNPVRITMDNRSRLHYIGQKGLDGFYKTIYEQCFDGTKPEKFRVLLSLLSPFQGPLSLTSLGAFASPPDAFLAGTSLSNVDIMTVTLHAASQGSGSRPFSFSTFLTSRGGNGESLIDTARAISACACIAERCIGIMDMHLKFNIANIPTSITRNQRIPDIKHRIETNIIPVLSYCCRFWPIYTSIALHGGADVPSLIPFLGTRTLQWLEVMSLIQSSPEIALTPLMNITAPPAALALVADIMQFVKTFAKPIGMSVPHIYISALAFMPRCSHFLSQLSQQRSHPGIAEVLEGKPAEWPCCLQILEGHSHYVRSSAFSPDGAQIASGSNDRNIRLWNTQTGTVLRESLSGHSGWVCSVVFSPDGSQIASGSSDATIRIWDSRTGAVLGKPLVGHFGWVNSVAFSPDGAQIASGSSDRTIRLWDIRTSAALGVPLVGHSGRVWSTVFSPDGAQIASGSDDKTIRLWDTRAGTTLWKALIGHSSLVLSVAFSPDGSKIASGSDDKTIRLWDTQTGSVIGAPLTGHGGPVWSVAFSPDGAQIASGSSDKTLRLWDTRTGAAVGEPLLGHSGLIRSVAFSPEGARMMSGSDDGTVRVWDTALAAKKRSHEPTVVEGYPSVSGSFGQPVTQSCDRARTVPPAINGLDSWRPQRSSSGGFILRRGWIVGPKGELLLWIPPAHRKRLDNRDEGPSYEPDKRPFTVDPALVFDFGRLKCGPQWTQCLQADSSP